MATIPTTVTIPATGNNPQGQPFSTQVTAILNYASPVADAAPVTSIEGYFVSYVGNPPANVRSIPVGEPVTIPFVPAPATTPPSPSTPLPGRPTPTTPTIPGHSGTTTGVEVPDPSQTGGLNPAKKETNGGAIAGAAIGGLVLGALIGFFIAMILYRKRQQKHNGSENGTYIVSSSVTESKGLHSVPPPAPAKDSGIQLDKFLLDATPDNEIARELHALGSLIQVHVENNYHMYPVKADPRQLALALKQLGLEDGQHSGIGGGSSLSAETIAALAIEPQTRYIALQHVISHVLFSSIDTSSRSRLSMLPAPVAAFLQSVAPTEGGRTNEEASAIALHQWRVLSTFLLHPSRSQRTPLPPSDNAVNAQAAGLANALDTFLGYFSSGDSGQQKSHLQAVIAETTKLGYVLLSQPSDWRFVHNDGAAARNNVAVVCAGLVKVTSRDGARYAAPLQVVAPVVVQV
ncbi:hypothetical protein QBC38DRAFT_135982 [Podospora fimiseda]|uniref:Uncharacterized protein n=1 Tax=Podospora fimiseda TaxID=252190 RepID=A0AAN7BST8_9PEZI|nr:hypothetical protein QBC38DRAFT_135982 [Podospora fimiseda]